MAEKVDVSIRIDKAEAHRINEIVDALKSKGLEQVESHVRFMIVNGSIRADAIDNLKQVKGVASVRRDQSYKPQRER